MSDVIGKEIEEMAEKMEKSQRTDRESLIATIKEMGPEALRAKLPTLAKSEQMLLKSVLEEISKAKAPEMDADYAASYVKGNIKDTVIQEDKADDDADEKLVKEKNAKMKNQGDNSPEGIEGQVIKSEGEEAGELEKGRGPDKQPRKKRDGSMPSAPSPSEFGTTPAKVDTASAKAIDRAKAKGKVSDKAAKDGKEQANYNSTKGGRYKGMDDIKAIARRKLTTKQETPEESKDFGRKRLDKLHANNARLKAKRDAMSKSDIEEIKNALIKSYEEVGVEYTVDELKKSVKELALEIFTEATPIKKSFAWDGPEALLKANRGGRNHHFSVNGYYDEALEKSSAPAEELVKSENKEEDLNDIIAKGADVTSGEVLCKSIIEGNKEEINGTLVKSFADNEIAQALGLTEEEAKQLLGE